MPFVLLLSACDRGSARQSPPGEKPKVELPPPAARAVSASDVALAPPRPLAEALPEVRRPSEPFGTAGPVAQLMAASSGAWVVACQARKDTDGDGVVAVTFGHHGEPHGDTMLRYLMVEGGAGQPIDELVASSSDDRRLAIKRGDRMELVDLVSSTVTELVAGLSPDDQPAITFGEDVVVIGRGSELTTVSLRDGAARRFALGDLVIGHAEVVADRWVALLVVTRDSNGDGKRTLPEAVGTMSDDPCVDPNHATYSVHGYEGDEPSVVWLDLRDAQLIDDPSALFPTDDGWLRSDDDRLIHAGREYADASCKPIALAVQRAPFRVVYLCAADGAESKLRVDGEGLARQEWIPIPVPPRAPPLVREIDTPTICERMESGTFCSDLTSGRHVIVDGWLAVRTPNGALLGDGAPYTLVDARTGAKTQVPVEGPPRAVSRRAALVGEQVIDLEDGRVIGRIPAGPAAAIADDGRVLTPASGTEYEWQGPLRWTTPTP